MNTVATLTGPLSAVDARRHDMPFGAVPEPDGGVSFRLWAPAQAVVRVEIRNGDEPAATLDLARDGQGWHTGATTLAGPGTRYSFVLGDGLKVPDPASRFQPEDCHGPSEVIDPEAYLWTDGDWQGRPWHEAVIYEMHVGAFTPEGTFAAATARLDALARLGVTAIEIMPVSDFPGAFNWGYDGVLPFAPDSRYGRPEDFKAFVDAAHRLRLMVLLDVVYNHFGPDGNYLGQMEPAYTTPRHKTPWGDGLNFDGADPFLRAFLIHNALYWIEEFHLDGLRLDAVHAILDDGPEHFLHELARRVRGAAGSRAVHLIAENEENAASLLERDAAGRPVVMTAQWNDDVHHVLHTAATGEEEGYYGEYLNDTDKLGRALAEGFVFQGQVMRFRGSARGQPSAHLPPTAFVSFLQNHDQTGNRAFGDRITRLASPAAVRAASAISLLAPSIPMLFMGEEWGTGRPFPFFCDHEGDLAASIRDGRRREFARFPAFADPEARARIPDPTSGETFASAKLDWAEREAVPHADWLAWTTAILRKRRAEIVPRLPDIEGGSGHALILGHEAVQVTWRLGDGAHLTLRANLGRQGLRCHLPLAGRLIWQEGQIDEDGLGPWAVGWYLREG